MAKMNCTYMWIIILFGINTYFTKAQEDYVYDGCFYDFFNGRILKDLVDCSDIDSCECSRNAPYCQTQFMTIRHCENICRSKNYKYFGLQAGNQCFCGGGFSRTNAWRIVVSASELERCRSPCAGNTDEECGGDFVMRVFRFTEPLLNSLCYHPGISDSSMVQQQALPDYFFDLGDSIHYTCAERGDKIIGTQKIECHDTGVWTSTPPSRCQCCAAECPQPVNPPGALISSESSTPDGAFYDGDSVTFTCFARLHTFSIRCTAIGATGVWTDPGNPCAPQTTTTTQKTTTLSTTTRRTTTTKAPTTTRSQPPPVKPPQCPTINCGFGCPYGFQLDNFGCLICACILPPVVPTIAARTTKAPTPRRPVCAPITECNTLCQFILDDTGCPVCECNPDPGSTQTTTVLETTTDTLNRQTTTSNQSKETTSAVKVATRSKNALTAYLPYIVGGAVLLGVILLVILAINCRQSKKHKGPAPPPPDYPTIDKKHFRHTRPDDAESGYDTITSTQKRRKKRRTNKNRYVHNDIENQAYTPASTISQNVFPQSFSNINSLDRSIIGGKHSSNFESLNRSLASGSLRPYPKQKKSYSPGLSLDRSGPVGRLTPNSQMMSQSMPRQSRFIPIDQMYANTLNRSVASDPNAFGTTKSAGSNQHRATTSYHNTPRSQHRPLQPQISLQSSRQSQHDSAFSLASTMHSPSSEDIFMQSEPQSAVTTPHHYQNSPHPSHRSMYANLPREGTLDRVNVDLSATEIIRDDHTYMDPMMVYKSADRAHPPQRAPSPETSLQRSHDRRRKKGVRGPKLRINKKMSASTSSINSLGSHFGDNKLEMTTPL